MKNISIGFKNISDKFKNNPTFIFWMLLIVLLLLEGWVLNGSYQNIRAVKKESIISITRQVRINFDQYDKAADRIEQGARYEPRQKIDSSPFGTIQLDQ